MKTQLGWPESPSNASSSPVRVPPTVPPKFLKKSYSQEALYIVKLQNLKDRAKKFEEALQHKKISEKIDFFGMKTSPSMDILLED
ncbi:hypothetical protein TetV_105 [Tetraselmis virus 1]|uniref:Uncharacterized protein n=1 Tax=Tetraselmis virus 1 TaxID=2060617 RepID=A0A2P0VMR5_9VIRU|nr:hypothetical protein QJ968_gp105 [Tetraselmis virus 1]AUF82197.1 hypothetical protein TetV_105 [Tetraselmis virus 1]